MAIAAPRYDRQTGETTIDDADDVQAILHALQDDDCRAVLDATGDTSLSASELAERCDLPLSTAYRKLETLTDAGLLTERTRLSPDGKHASEYIRAVDEVVVDAEAGFELTISRRDQAGDGPVGPIVEP